MKTTIPLSLLLSLTFPLAHAATFDLESSAKQVVQEELHDTAQLAADTLGKVQSLTKQPCAIPEDDNFPLASEFKQRGADCTKFITDSGSIGPWGNAIIKKIDSLPKEEAEMTFYSNKIPDMPFICPNFSQFSYKLKKKFWVWTFASIARDESCCKPSVTAQGVSCQAVGLLQLEGTLQLRKNRGESCKVASIKEAENNLACGVDMMKDQLLGSRGGFFKGTKAPGELFWKSGYWQHLRLRSKDIEAAKKALVHNVETDNQETDIKSLIMRFPFCR